MDRNSRPATQPTAKNGKSSPFRGVTLFRPTGKWRAQISTGGKTMSLGDHNTEQEAARAFDRALIHKDGPCARTNFPIQDYEPEIAYLQGVSMEQLIADLRMMARRSGRSCQAHRKRSVRAPPPTDGRQEKRGRTPATRIRWRPSGCCGTLATPTRGLSSGTRWRTPLGPTPAWPSPTRSSTTATPSPSRRPSSPHGCGSRSAPIPLRGQSAPPVASRLQCGLSPGRAPLRGRPRRSCTPRRRAASACPPNAAEARPRRPPPTRRRRPPPQRLRRCARTAPSRLTAGAKNRRCLKAPSRAPCT
uniref:AP2/ERF domain-containing protein n=1 Tax=Tetraselmis sp. GSL018 TaxID=582737 RepID=A0A061RPL9_9CHLO